MPVDIPEHGIIRTPVDLDLAAREAQRLVNRSVSPLYRFSLLVDFLRRTAHLPELWTASYIRTFYPVLSACIRHEYVCYVDPGSWQIVLRTLISIKNADWVQREASFADTESAAWNKCSLSLATMHAFRELHLLLREHGWVHSDLTKREWAAVINAGTIGLDPCREYCDILLSHDACPPFLLRARERWEHSRADGQSPGVVLLDELQIGGMHAGLVLHIDVAAGKSGQTRVHFRNVLDEKNTTTIRQLTSAANAASQVVESRFQHSVPMHEWTVGFHEHEAAYAGESMGLATALAMAQMLQKDFNRAMRWDLQPHLVCTGGIADDGSVNDLPDSVLESKVHAAFFSPVDGLVLPAAHAENARGIVLRLQQRYPARRLEVYGVDSLDDCIAAPGIIRTEHRTMYDRTSEFVRRNAVLLLAALVFLLAVGGGYFWWKSRYDYPDLEYAYGQHIEENSLVYNPRHSEEWQFRDYGRVVAPELPFGDLEVGADATRNVYLWNMTPSNMEVQLGIEGPQADQWYISWNGDRQRVTATDSLRVMIKYVPDHPSTLNRARFTVRNPETGELLTSLNLTGAAGSPRPAGYALYLDGIDDMLFFGELAIAFARDEATIEFWLRIDDQSSCIFSNNRNIPQGPALQNMTISHYHDTLGIQVGNNASMVVPSQPLSNDDGWHHFALSFSRQQRRISFLIDGEVVLEKREEFIIEGVAMPFVTIGAYNNDESVQAPFRGAIDELRVWDHALPPDTVRERMRRRVNGLTPGLLGYWDFDVVSEISAHNANERTQDGRLFGRPAYIRSGVPLEGESDDIRVVRGQRTTKAMALLPCRWLQCGSDPVAGAPERSYAIRFRRDTGINERILTVMNQDAYLTLSSDQLQLAGSRPHPLQTRRGWNTFVGRVSRAQEMDVFVNGSFVLTCTDGQFQWGSAYRYEGLQVGIFNDKYNNFGPKYFDSSYPERRMGKTVSDFRVWKRRITDEMVAAFEHGDPTPDGLVAHWPLDALPDRNGNYADLVAGHLLHVWRYPAWE